MKFLRHVCHDKDKDKKIERIERPTQETGQQRVKVILLASNLRQRRSPRGIHWPKGYAQPNADSNTVCGQRRPACAGAITSWRGRLRLPRLLRARSARCAVQSA